MKKQNRSCSRINSGITKLNRKNMKIIQDEGSQSDNSNENNNSTVIKKRRQYTLSEKNKIIEQY